MGGCRLLAEPLYAAPAIRRIRARQRPHPQSAGIDTLGLRRCLVPRHRRWGWSGDNVKAYSVVPLVADREAIRFVVARSGLHTERSVLPLIAGGRQTLGSGLFGGWHDRRGCQGTVLRGGRRRLRSWGSRGGRGGARCRRTAGRADDLTTAGQERARQPKDDDRLALCSA